MIPVITRAATVVGSISKLSRDIGAFRNDMYGWTRVPKSRVLKIEKAQLKAIADLEKKLEKARKAYADRHVLRPDLFPKQKGTK